MSAIKNKLLDTFAAWQDQRTIWILGGVIALSLDIFSYAFFQKGLKLDPCEMCVYIRFSMIVIFIGAMIAAINPRVWVLKIIGYVTVIWAIVKGFLWSVHLEKMFWQSQALAAGADPFAVGVESCSLFPTFPFHLPLDQWMPDVFQPQGICGIDPWRFLGWNMAEMMFVVYAAFAVLVLLMLAGFIVRLLKSFGKK
ncbi:MAG: disulfide bond formation protein B [Burkholderiales bacterium]|jgi:disulfide bond formation protein DsbB|nr:disulfide bond formation protein B [Burkholderiales bacterium]